jgi:hypothetical protein
VKNSKVVIICNVILLFFFKLEDTSTKGVKKEIEKGQIMAKIKKTNNYLQNTTKKT